MTKLDPLAPVTGRKAGDGALMRAKELALRQLVGVLLALAVLLGSWYILRKGLLVCLIELGALAAMFGIYRYYEPQIKSWFAGAAGEMKVGDILDGLAGDGWFAIHEIQTGRGNIDHVVIGTGGIFTLETKSRKGRIKPDWVREEHLKQAYAEAKWVGNVTGEKVQPLLVFSDAYLIGGRGIARRRGVVLLPARMLDGFFKRQKPQVTVEQARALHERFLAAVAPA